MVDKNAAMAEKRPGSDAEKTAAINFARRHTNSFKFVSLSHLDETQTDASLASAIRRGDQDMQARSYRSIF